MTILIFVLGIFLTWFNVKAQNVLICLCASLTWLALAMWLFFDPDALIGLGSVWKDILVWVFFVLFFVPIVLQMNTEVKKEIKDHDGNTYTFNEYGDKPSGLKKVSSGYDDYRKELRKRLRR